MTLRLGPLASMAPASCQQSLKAPAGQQLEVLRSTVLASGRRRAGYIQPMIMIVPPRSAAYSQGRVIRTESSGT